MDNKQIEIEQTQKLKTKLEEARALFLQKKYSEAKPMIQSFLDEALVLNKEDETRRFFSFRNITDFYYATKKLKISKDMVWSALDFSLAYNMLSYIANEEKDFGKAREYCDKAIYYNPIATVFYAEKAETYKYEKDFDNMFRVANESYEYIFYHNELARYYRNLGFYYTEKSRFDVSFALYLISLHFELSSNAYHEIGYIRNQLNDPKFTMSTEKALEILKENNIPFGIKEENKAIIKSFLYEKELQEKDPKSLEYVTKEIELYDTPLESTEELLAPNEPPKITSSDIFDENKIILDDLDKERRRKNIELLKSQNVIYLEEMKSIPINSATTLRTKEEIVKRMLGDYVISYFCIFIGNPNFNGEAALSSLDQKFGIKANLNPSDIEYVNAIMNKKLSPDQIRNNSWLIEECSVLMWALSLMDKPSQSAQCDLNRINAILASFSSYEDLSSKCNLRAKEEILELDDLVTRYQWACREARIKNKQMPQVIEGIVQEQQRGLDWALTFDINKLMKDNIDIKYEKGDLRFQFTVPTTYILDTPRQGFNQDLFLTVKNPKTFASVAFYDLGKCTSEDFGRKYDIDVNNHKETGYNIIGEYTLSALNLKDGIKQLITTKTIDNITLGMAKYYFLLNGHLILLDAMLSNKVDYNDFASISNDDNNLVAVNMAFSMKELTNVDIPETIAKVKQTAEMSNYKSHAEQLDIPVINGFDIEQGDSRFPSVVFTATYRGSLFTEQLVSDGPLNQNETFEQRINLVVKNGIEAVKQFSVDNNDKSMFYYQDYSNSIFNYKIYVGDTVFDTKVGKKVSRSLNAFFVDPKFNDFYQFSISSPMMVMPVNSLKLGVVDLETDEMTIKLYEMLRFMMDNLKYKDNIIMNNVEVSLKETNDPNIINADPKQLYKAAVESSVRDYLNIQGVSPEDEKYTKDLYRMILVCGEFESPVVDEYTLSEYLKDDERVINLVRKFPEINAKHFANELNYLSFSLEDNINLRRYIEILRNSFKRQ